MAERKSLSTQTVYTMYNIRHVESSCDTILY